MLDCNDYVGNKLSHFADKAVFFGVERVEVAHTSLRHNADNAYVAYFGQIFVGCGPGENTAVAQLYLAKLARFAYACVDYDNLAVGVHCFDKIVAVTQIFRCDVLVAQTVHKYGLAHLRIEQCADARA